MNLAIFSGNIGRDPELREAGGDPVLGFSLGVQTGTKDKPLTMWVDCAIWGKRAISLQPYLTKGMRVCVSGPVKFEEYQTKEGATRFRLRITVDQLDMPPKHVSEAVPQAQPQQAAAPAKPPAHLADMTDDIPF